jgi:integrase
MNIVEPIRDLEKIEEIKNFLKKKSYRDYVLFNLGINCGLRISDLLKLKVKDVRGKYHLKLKETKTKKNKNQKLPLPVVEILEDYIEGKDDDEYLFQSRKGVNKPLQRQRAFSIIKEAAEHVGLESIATHTLRKTFGYHFYQRKKDVALLQDIFNHAAPSITLRYIGINQDVLDKAMDDFYL